MKTKLILIFSAVLLGLKSYPQLLPEYQQQQQPNPEGLVKWLTFKEAQELNKKMQKPFLVDVYTDWCGWCKTMMKTTYSDPGLAGYINAYFYPVKFNAETKDTIEYNGVKYWNESKQPKTPHMLAKKMLGTSLTYPSTIFVANNFQFNLLTQGYLDVKKIEPVLIYTVENIYRTSTYDDFKKMFDRAFYDSLKMNHPENIKWYSLKQALELQKKSPRKIIVSIGTTWCSGCKVMNQTTFCDSVMFPYLNKNYYMVDLNAETKDTIEYGGKTYYGAAQGQGNPFHSIVPVLTKNNFVLPSLVFMDEKQKILESIPFYQGPPALEPVIRYFGENTYLTTKWADYIKKVNAEKEKKAGTRPGVKPSGAETKPKTGK